MEMRLFTLCKTLFQSALCVNFLATLIYVNSSECNGSLCVAMFSFSVSRVWSVLGICIQQRVTVGSDERAAQHLYSRI